MKLILTFIFFSFCIHAYSQNFEIYVSDAGNFNSPPWQILKFDENGQNPSVFINSNLYWPQDILFLEDANEVLISNLDGCINRHNGSTGAFISNFACSISGPTRIKIGPDSLLYVLQWGGNGKVKQYNLNGTYLGEFTSIGVPQSIGLDWDSNDNLYVSSYNGDFVRKFDTSGNDLGIFINSNLLGPTNIWFDSNGDLLVADYNGTAVKRFDSNGTYQSDFITGLSKCEGFDFLPNGNILIGNGGTSSVKMFDSNGNYIEDFINSGAGNLIQPNAVRIREINTTTPNRDIEFESISVNPTLGNEFLIKFPSSYMEENSIVIFNSLGQIVQQLNGGHEIIWDASSQPNGMYFIYLAMENEEVHLLKKIIVQQF